MRRQRGRLLERHIAVIEARARQGSTRGDDRSIDVDDGGRNAVADLRRWVVSPVRRQVNSEGTSTAIARLATLRLFVLDFYRSQG